MKWARNMTRNVARAAGRIGHAMHDDSYKWDMLGRGFCVTVDSALGERCGVRRTKTCIIVRSNIRTLNDSINLFRLVEFNVYGVWRVGLTCALVRRGPRPRVARTDLRSRSEIQIWGPGLVGLIRAHQNGSQSRI